MKIARAKLELVVERIAHEKMSVVSACEGICEARTFFRYLAEDEALSQLYARARETRADARFESIDGVLGALQKGTIDAQTARVMVDTIKWQCAHEKPKRYGDKVAVESTGADGGPIQLEETGAKALLAAELDRTAARLGTGATSQES